MPTAATSGLRALQALKYLRSVLAGKSHRLIAADRYGGDLAAVLKEQEKLAADNQDSRHRQEFAELFCLLRDLRYAGRGRRWLYARAAQGKLDAANIAWLAFARENRGTGLSRQVTGDPDLLAEESFATLMKRDDFDARDSSQV